MEVSKLGVMLLGILVLLITPTVIALGSNLPLVCGGNENIIIGCLGNEDLFFIGSLVTAAEVPSGGQQPDLLLEEPEPIIIEKEIPPPFISLTNLNQFLISKGFTQLEIYIFEIFIFGGCFCWFIIIYKRSKKEKKRNE